MRSPFYCYRKSDGTLVSTLFLTADEASYRSNITTVEPPQETIELMAVFDADFGLWSLVPRPQPPAI